MAFPLIQIDAALHPAHGGFFKSSGNDFIGGQLVFDVKLKDSIENIVWR